VPLIRHILRTKIDPKTRVKDQLQDLGQAHVEDAVGGEEDGIAVSDKMAQHKDPEATATPRRQDLPMLSSPLHPPLLLQSQQPPTHLKAQEILEIDGTEGATEVVLEAQRSRAEAYLQWGLDDNLVVG
jgi:hypothetical protein